MAVQLELVQKSGSWFSIGDERIGQGRQRQAVYHGPAGLMDQLEEQIQGESLQAPEQQVKTQPRRRTSR